MNHYLDRGDCKTFKDSPKIQSNVNRVCQRNRRLSTRIDPTVKRKRRSSNLSGKGTDRLKCAEGTFRVHKIYGDGNCMFRAISYILWQNEGEHRVLRSMVAEHIRDHWQEYRPFVIAEWNISDRHEYYEYMSMEGRFACELECTVATTLHHMNLSIYREINDGCELKRVFHNRISAHYETARLLFTGCSDSGHYDVLFAD